MINKLKLKFKPISFTKRKNKQTPRVMLEKANASALAGAPLSWFLNVVITVPVTAWALSEGLHPLIIAGILWIPFYLASVQRMFTVDFVYAYYNIDIDPSRAFKKLWGKLKRK